MPNTRNCSSERFSAKRSYRSTKKLFPELSDSNELQIA